MSLMPATELTTMRSVQQETMTDTCTRRRISTTTNDLGEVVESYTDLSLSCRTAAPQGVPAVTTAPGAQTYHVDLIATVPAGSDVLVNDHMVCASNEYRVVAVSEGTFLTATRVMLERIA